MAEPGQIDVEKIERACKAIISECTDESEMPIVDLARNQLELLAYIKQVDEARHQGVK